MKKLFAAMLALCVCLGALAGCHKTPESPIVIGKNVDSLLENAQKEDAGGSLHTGEPADANKPAGTGETAVDLYARLGAPKAYSVELTSAKGRLHVFTDADVLLPSCELPIVRVKPVEFTTEQAKQFATVLMGSDANYVEFDYNRATKAQYMRSIELFRYGLADWEGRGQYIFDMQYDTPEEAEAALKQIMEKAVTAPDAFPSYTPEFQWRKEKAWINGKEVENNYTFMDLFATEDNAIYSSFKIANTLEFDGVAEMTYFRDDALPGDIFFDDIYKGPEKLTITAQSAQQLAEQTIANMGIAGFTCVSNILTRYRTRVNFYYPVYHASFTRQIGGVTETLTDAEEVHDGFNTNWHYESIHVLVDDEGVLRAEYHSPYEVMETVLGKTELLPFAKIQEVFEKMVLIVGNDVDFSETWSDSGGMEYHITTVRLGLMSIREQNKGTGLLIPVWDFLGYQRGRMSAEQEWHISSENELKSFLTINAVDGSVIDRGY